MNSIRKRLKALYEQRKDTEPAGIIIGTQCGYLVFAFDGTNFPEFASEQEARDALAAHGIKKIGIIGGAPTGREKQ